jgi:hypothetical protein
MFLVDISYCLKVMSRTKIKVQKEQRAITPKLAVAAKTHLNGCAHWFIVYS